MTAPFCPDYGHDDICHVKVAESVSRIRRQADYAWRPEDVVLLATVPFGDVAVLDFEAATRSVQDGLEFWSDGTTKLIRSRFLRDEMKPGFETHDLCVYCAADNGPNGELRQGYDCWNCGGN
jgi:hypothetical protein